MMIIRNLYSYFFTVQYVMLNIKRHMVNWLSTGLYFQRDLLLCMRALLHIAQVRHFTAYKNMDRF
jgi:hypothetical protein